MVGAPEVAAREVAEQVEARVAEERAGARAEERGGAGMAGAEKGRGKCMRTRNQV